MLDLEALVAHIHDLAADVSRSAEATLARRDAAQAQLGRAASMPALREAVVHFEQDMALPVDGRRMDATTAAPPTPGYTVLATDGSQIAPDYHHIAPWYVINTGAAVLRYGGPEGRDRCRLSSHPTLKPPRIGRTQPADAAEEAEGRADGLSAAQVVSPRVEVERLLAELALALELVEAEADAGRTVLLLDGPLVQWRLIQDLRASADSTRVTEAFRALLDRCRETGTAVAGFISQSRAVEWITLLRFSLCPEVPSRGRLCSVCRTTLLGRNTEPPPGAHHAPLAGLRDIQLAAALLERRGERTEVIELQSRVWRDVAGEEGSAGFFYLRTGDTATGGEIARVELPRWVWEDETLMRRLHACLADQCDSGGGYPMVLAEAHEEAVVRASDREAFYQVIERVLTDRGVYAAATSAKARSKRRPGA